MSTANKDGWIEWNGGGCPVDGITIVDVMLRDGTVCEGEDADKDKEEWIWSHDCGECDIIAYRPHKPAAQNPFEWRDRIREIDDSIKSTEAEFNEKMDALEEERVSLVQRLAYEGFRLIGSINEKLDGLDQRIPQHEADMNDPKNWKYNDVIQCTDNEAYGRFSLGELYGVIGVSNCGRRVYVMNDDNGDLNGWSSDNFKFYSRPSDKK